MCVNSDYKQLLKGGGVTPTPNRLRVMEIIDSNNFSLSATDIHETLER